MPLSSHWENGGTSHDGKGRRSLLRLRREKRPLPRARSLPGLDTCEKPGDLGCSLAN